MKIKGLSKKSTIPLSGDLLVKIILGTVVFIFIVILFTGFFPFLSDQRFFAKI